MAPQTIDWEGESTGENTSASDLEPQTPRFLRKGDEWYHPSRQEILEAEAAQQRYQKHLLDAWANLNPFRRR